MLTGTYMYRGPSSSMPFRYHDTRGLSAASTWQSSLIGLLSSTFSAVRPRVNLGASPEGFCSGCSCSSCSCCCCFASQITNQPNIESFTSYVFRIISRSSIRSNMKGDRKVEFSLQVSDGKSKKLRGVSKSFCYEKQFSMVGWIRHFPAY